MQRRVCEVLDGAEGNEVALRELRRRLGEPDRSNLRRAIRGLLEREIVEESRVGGTRRVGLTSWDHVVPKPSPEAPRPRIGRHRARPRYSERALEEALEEARRVLRVGRPREPGNYAPGATSFANARSAARRRAGSWARCGGTPIPWSGVCRWAR